MITRREKPTFPSVLPSDSFCQSPVRQHLFTEQAKSPQVTTAESQAGRKRVVRSSPYGQRPRGGRGAASALGDVT